MNDTITETAGKVTQSLITTMPAQFLMLCVLNAVFLGAVLLFINTQVEGRIALVNKVFDACLAQQGALPR